MLTRDCRLASGSVMQIGLDTALSMGYRVFLSANPMSTPASYFTAFRISTMHPGTMGITVTASHNPGRYIGLKFTVPGLRAVGQDCGPLGGLTRIKELYHSRMHAGTAGKGSLKLVNYVEDYIETAFALSGLRSGDLQGIQVVLETLNGAAGPEIFAALQEAGADTDALDIVPDGNFPKGSPNPTSARKMDEAVRIAGLKPGAAVIGMDGDGDRLVFGDARGILSAGLSAIPVLEALKHAGIEENPLVLCDPKVNPPALVEWSCHGFSPIMFRNGHSQIKDYMNTKNAVMAVEESGHFFHRLHADSFRAYMEYSLFTVLLFLRRLKECPAEMDRLWDIHDSLYSSGEINYQFADDAVRDEAMQRIVMSLKLDGAAERSSTQDGVSLGGIQLNKGITETGGTYTLANDWYSVFVRVSTNEKAVLRIFLTSRYAEFGKRLSGRLRHIMEADFRGIAIE